MTGIRPYQRRSGTEGEVEVRCVCVDAIVAREADGTMSVYEPGDFERRFPVVTRPSPLERLEASR